MAGEYRRRRTRLALAAAILILTGLGSLDALAQGSATTARTPNTADTRSAAQTTRDSLRRILGAITNLRRLNYRLSLLEQQAKGHEPLSSGFLECEIRVAEYCYGPKNGYGVLGGIGTVPVKRRYGLVRYNSVDERRINTMIRMYLDTVNVYIAKNPADRWLSAESVRLDLDRGYFVRAYESLGACVGEKWWCGALRGHTMVLAGVRDRSGDIWQAVLRDMPLKESCAWMDPTWISNSKTFNTHYRSLDCPARLRIAERVWWLSDPFWSVPGNERLSEHLSE